MLATNPAFPPGDATAKFYLDPLSMLYNSELAAVVAWITSHTAFILANYASWVASGSQQLLWDGTDLIPNYNFVAGYLQTTQTMAGLWVGRAWDTVGP